MKYIIVVLFFFTSISSIAQTSDEVVVLLHEIDDQSTRFGGQIFLIEEFNFGIPGGKNWLVEWKLESSRTGIHLITMIYVVNGITEEIIFVESLGARRIDQIRPFTQHLESLPGRTVGPHQIGDFNGEGFDMILTNTGDPAIVIIGFNTHTGRFELIFDENFDDQYENSPIRFIRYRGRYGFMVREGDPPQVAGGPNWIPDPPNPRAGRWFFYTWDREQFTFVEIGEVDKAGIK